MWVCALGLQFRLPPANPGVGVGFCVFVCALRLYPATLRCGVRCGCVCLGSGFSCAPPILAGVLSCVFWCVRSACTPPILALVYEVGLGALVWVLAAPCHSWLGCAMCVCVLGIRFWLRPAIPGWGVRVCVCFCARSACTPPMLARVCSVGVSAWAHVLAAPRKSWLGCWVVFLVCALCLYSATPCWGVRCGCVCLGSGFSCAPPFLAGVLGCVCRGVPSTCTPPFLAGVCGLWVGCFLAPVPVPWFVPGCARRPGLRHPVAVVAWHLSVCLGCGRPRACLTCLVDQRWCAAPHLVRSLLVLRSASSRPWCLSEPQGACATLTAGWLRGARGVQARTGLFVPAAGRCPGSCAGLSSRRTRSGACDGVVPGRSLGRLSWAACAAVVCVCGPGHWRVLFPVRSVFRRATWSLHRGCFVCTATPPLLGRKKPRPGPVPVCVCVLLVAGSGGPASRGRFGAPHLLPLTVPMLFLSVGPPACWGCPACGCGFVFFPFFLRSSCLQRFVFSSPGLSWPLTPCRTPSLFFSSPPPRFFFPGFPVLFFFAAFFCFCRVLPSVCCWAGVCVLGCGVCWCVLLWELCPCGRRFALALCPSVLPGCACSLCLVACRVACVQWRRVGGVFPVLPLVPCLRALSSGLVLCRLQPVVAPLVFCRGCPVTPGLVVLFRLALVCVVFVSLVWCFAPLWGAVWCPPPQPWVLCADSVFRHVCAGCVTSPRLVAVPSVVRCCPLGRVVLRSVVWPVFGVAWCCVACLCWTEVLRRAVPRRIVRGLVEVFLLCSAVVCCFAPCWVFFRRCSSPSRGAPGSFCLSGSLAWCVLLFGVALLPCVLVLAPAALCCSLLCSAVLRVLNLCCVVRLVAVVGSRLAWCAAVAGCCALFSGAVLCCPAVLPVVRCCRCSALRCVVVRCDMLSPSIGCCRALCCVLGRCTLPWGPMLSGAVCCLVSPRCVLYAVCVLAWSVGACCWSPLCSVLCASWGVVLCVICHPSSVWCSAALSWRSCVVLFFWCVLFLAPGDAVHCCLLCRFMRCCAVLLRAVPRRAVARCVVLRPPARASGCPVVRCGLLCGPALPRFPALVYCALWCCGAVCCCGVLSGYDFMKSPDPKIIVAADAKKPTETVAARAFSLAESNFWLRNLKIRDYEALFARTIEDTNHPHLFNHDTPLGTAPKSRKRSITSQKATIWPFFAIFPSENTFYLVPRGCGSIKGVPWNHLTISKT